MLARNIIDYNGGRSASAESKLKLGLHNCSSRLAPLECTSLSSLRGWELKDSQKFGATSRIMGATASDGEHFFQLGSNTLVCVLSPPEARRGYFSILHSANHLPNNRIADYVPNHNGGVGKQP